MRISDWSSDVCSSDLKAQPFVERHIRRRRGFEPAGQPFGVGGRGLGADDAPAMALALFGRANADIVEIPEASLWPVRVDAALHLQPARQGGAEGRDEREHGSQEIKGDRKSTRLNSSP